ncbi:hypothetical protein [Salisaeta longa]|uniref:hypothetical protein n=1 Tax=Salisaeta longa TaxID=503170 RepID=UPI0003B5119D|nr:hypothetical protein [Salisaeta longa]
MRIRTTASLACVLLFLLCATPSHAQLRATSPSGPSPVRLYQQASDALDGLLPNDRFKMNHSFSMSFGSFGGRSTSLGMYTNTMMWQLNDELAARADVSLAYSPMNNSFGQQQAPRVILQNLEVAYKPTDNMSIRFQMRQSPYGAFHSPYGYRRGYGHGVGFMQPTATESLFWSN